MALVPKDICHRSISGIPVQSSLALQNEIAIMGIFVPCLKDACCMWDHEKEMCLEVRLISEKIWAITKTE